MLQVGRAGSVYWARSTAALLLVALLARPDRSYEALVNVRGKALPPGLLMEDDRPLERAHKSLCPLTVLVVKHELGLDLGVELSVEVLREGLNELLAVVYV